MASLPFHFWTAVFFTVGALVGSFLNVCIHRLPRGMSIVKPPSHCPHCQFRIPCYLNIPLITWLWLRGRCAKCAAPISARYFLVELLTAIAFAAAWNEVGHAIAWKQTALIAAAYSLLFAGLIAATFIDLEHFIIPDEITIGGTIAGVLTAAMLPELFRTGSSFQAIKWSLIGAGTGALIVYAILLLGKLAFGRQKIELPADTRIYFTEANLVLPGEAIPYDEIFYRGSDTIRLHAARLELIDRCYVDVPVRLSQRSLFIGSEKVDPAALAQMEAVTSQIIIPREAMGLGDVKFMAAIGAFLGWQAAVFSLLVSAMIGAVAGIALIAIGKRDWSAKLPYGPYIALTAFIWVFSGHGWPIFWWLQPNPLSPLNPLR
jgi:leader peptidase (prepilin peptidase)/N-methyltransferase